MAMSGVAVNEECVTVFENLKMGRQFLYIIYRVTDDLRTIKVEEIGSHYQTYEDFVQRLKDAESKRQCRYAVFDVKFYQNAMPQQRLAFFLWSPDTATTQQKMLYSSSKMTLLKKLEGIPVVLQCNDEDDLSMCNVLDRCISKYK
ncbi:actophorin-like [Haliotis rubra]|uniref:actophorin-like n=1 Tax=Haliotis rubra TaxID=36100 RepID=UPI001EE5E791|nr:actophorin-like [Haliotis rubra]